MATFLNSDRKVIARRIGMELTSKQSGAPYRVFSRQEWVDRDAMPRTILKREQSSVDQVYSEAKELLSSRRFFRGSYMSMLALVILSTLAGFYVAHTCCRQRKPRRRVSAQLVSDSADL